MHFKPEKGEMIRVGRDSTATFDREFVVYFEGFYHCKDTRGEKHLVPWPYAEETPRKSEPIPYTSETWPRRAVCLRNKGWGSYGIAFPTRVGTHGVGVDGGLVYYDNLKHDYQMSFDFGATWQPCHYIPK